MNGKGLERLPVLIGIAACLVLGYWWRYPGRGGDRADPLSHQGRAIELAMGDGRLLDALPQVQALVRAHPRDPFPRYLEATIDQRLERWSDAAAAWELYLTVSLEPSTACPMIAEAYQRAGDRQRALDRYRQCATLEPDNPDGLTDLADALASGGAVTEARGVYERAAALDPANPLVARALQNLKPADAAP